jgi:hypothetical protein
VTRTTRPYRWRAQNVSTMRQLEGTAATLSRAEAAAERARAKLGSETDLVDVALGSGDAHRRRSRPRSVEAPHTTAVRPLGSPVAGISADQRTYWLHSNRRVARS